MKQVKSVVYKFRLEEMLDKLDICTERFLQMQFGDNTLIDINQEISVSMQDEIVDITSDGFSVDKFMRQEKTQEIELMR